MRTEWPKVEVLLSYYLGKEYIEDQLQSIYDQDYPGAILIRIRDDGSPSNDPLKIPSSRKDGFERKILFQKGRNLGASGSFLQLIQDAGEADYYFFSDQDDIWDLKKIRTAVLQMEKKPSGNGQMPLLWCCNYLVTDMSGREIIGEKDGEIHLNDKTFHFLYGYFYNSFPGCTMGMNKSLMTILKDLKLKTSMMHDRVAVAVAIACGRIMFEEEVLVFHRIHGNNVIGYHKMLGSPYKWIREKIRLFIKKENYDVCEVAERLTETVPGMINPIWKEDVSLLRDYKRSFIRKVRLLRHPDLQKDKWRERLSIHGHILFGLF